MNSESIFTGQVAMQSKHITVIVVNFKTPNLVEEAVTTFMDCYPEVQYILIDNGGCRESVQILRAIEQQAPRVQIIENEENLGHGPALNQGFDLAKTEYVFTLDSDTRVEQCGFLEEMIANFKEDSKLFALGWLRCVNENGVAFKRSNPNGHPYVHPHAALYRRAFFKELEPFDNCGAPSILLMKDAIERGYHLEDFPIQNYIWHKVAGTRGMFRGRCVDIPTDKEPEEWRFHRI